MWIGTKTQRKGSEVGAKEVLAKDTGKKFPEKETETRAEVCSRGQEEKVPQEEEKGRCVCVARLLRGGQ